MSAVRFGAPEEWPVCGACAAEVEYADCWNCGGEGGRDLYEEDPLAYELGEWSTCEECGGNCTLIFCSGDCGQIERTTFRPLVVVSGERL